MYARRAVAAALILSLAGCATVSHGPMQRIDVYSRPVTATVRTSECGPGSTKRVTTPATVWVSRRAERCALTFAAPGYQPRTMFLRRGISDDVFDNTALAEDLCDDDGSNCNSLSDWFGVAVVAAVLVGAGVGVDAVTGAMFEQRPSAVSVELQPAHEPR